MKIKFSEVSKKIKKDIALDRVAFDIPGKGVTGIFGDYGSGKSTILSILSGFSQFDSGSVFIDGQEVKFKSNRDAIRMGIGNVDPDLELFDRFTIRENILLNPTYRPSKISEYETKFEEFCKQLNIDFKFDDLLGNYPPHEKIIFEVIRIITHGSKLMLLDEPLRYFNEENIGFFKNLLQLLRDNGIQVILTTNHQTEVKMLCDDCIMVDNGIIHGYYEKPFSNLPNKYTAEKKQFIQEITPSDNIMLDLSNLQTALGHGLVNYQLRSGEIAGVYTEEKFAAEALLRCIVGLEKPVQGSISLNGFDLTQSSFTEYVADGVAYIPEDKIAEGLIPELTIGDHFGLIGDFVGRTFNPMLSKQIIENRLTAYDIHQQINTAVKDLSKQDLTKLMFALLPSSLSLLVCFSPTNALDSTTANWVWNQLYLRAKGGTTVIVFESSLDLLVNNVHAFWFYENSVWQAAVSNPTDDQNTMKSKSVSSEDAHEE